jgi:peptidoglycan/xylan/chitin deacetylase (PgdA/CDA1 family)
MRRRLPGWRTVKRLGRDVRDRRRPHVVILGYHQVAERRDDPFDLAVSPAELEAHLRFLAQHARPVPLRQAAEEVAEGRIPPRTVVVTFDDGYEDTLTTALPLLQRFRIPATVFVTTGNPGQPFWWDTLAEIVRQADAFPEHVVLDHPGGGVPLPTRDRPRFLAQVSRSLRTMEVAERASALAILARACGAAHVIPAVRALTAAEIRSLASDPLIEVGGHTVTHPPLADVPRARQEMEITDARQALERLLGQPVRAFAYPHGSHTASARELVRQAGYRIGCASDPHVVTAASDMLALPRLWVDGPRRQHFERWLGTWLGGP